MDGYKRKKERETAGEKTRRGRREGGRGGIEAILRFKLINWLLYKNMNQYRCWFLVENYRGHFYPKYTFFLPSNRNPTCPPF